MKKLLLYILILCIFSSVVLSLPANTYRQLGNDAQDYKQGLGIFGESTTSVIESGSRQLTLGMHTPLVADLDGDGTEEIIIFDLNQIRIFRNNSLDNVDSYSIGYDPFQMSNIVIQDMDGDAYLEIMFAENEDSTHALYRLRILEYNGTDINNISIIGGGASYLGGDLQLGCTSGVGQGRCLVASEKRITTNVAEGVSQYQIFNGTSSVVAFTDTGYSSSGTGATCSPRVRSVQVQDINNDDKLEFIWTTAIISEGGGDGGSIHAVEVATGNFLGNQALDGVWYDGVSGSTTCNVSQVSNRFTSPLVINIDGGAHKEICVAHNEGEDTYRLYCYRGSLFPSDNSPYRFPNTLFADGQIISNPFSANIFPETGEDVCLLGFETIATISTIDMLCASLETDFNSIKSLEFKAVAPFELGNFRLLSNNIVHASQQRVEDLEFSGTGLAGVDHGTGDPDEIITPYGVLGINWDDIFDAQAGCRIIGIFDDCDIRTLDFLYHNPLGDSAVIMASADNEGETSNTDMLSMTFTKLKYFDDQATDANAFIRNITTNPCISSGAIKVNQTLQVRVTPVDPDPAPDSVRSRVILYYGSTNELDSGWSVNGTSGQTRVFNFELNKTITTGTIRVSVTDTDNSDTYINKDLPFSVGTTGFEFGDSSCTAFSQEDPDAIVADTPVGETDEDSNAIKDTVDELLGLGAFSGLGYDIIWLLLMTAFALWMFFFGGTVASGILPIAVVEGLMLVLGVKLGFLSAGILIIISLILVAVLVIYFGAKLVGTGSTG